MNKSFSFVKQSKILDDPKYDKYLKNWLGTQNEWKCIYRASEYGYTAKPFHSNCDGKIPTLIVIKSHNGCIFGGYTTQSWSGNDITKIDHNAFLFTLKNLYNTKPTRYNAFVDKGGIRCKLEYGILFGTKEGIDLWIRDNCNNENSCFINTDGTKGYECDSLYKNSLFVNTNNPDHINMFSVSELEVFSSN